MISSRPSARIAAFTLLSVLLASAATAETASYTAIFGGKNVGHLTATTEGDTTQVDFDYKNNGRGPSSVETIRVDRDGLPVSWKIKGATTFGSKVAESFTRNGNRAEWVDSTGKGSAAVTQPALYVAQSASP